MKDLINSIIINKANLEHIAETGIISGTLLKEIERVLKEIELATMQKLINDYTIK